MPREAPPTIAQVYAIAIALCGRVGERFPETRADASALIAKLGRDISQRANENGGSRAVQPGGFARFGGDDRDVLPRREQ